MGTFIAVPFKGMRLNDYVANKEKETLLNLVVASPFGLETDGNFVNSWQMNYQRIELFTRYRGYSELAPHTFIRITVPKTDTGVEPLVQDEQPFGWDGRINEETAERAVWWAFDLLTEKEASQFLNEHRPVVIFEYVNMGAGKYLTVQFTGGRWIVLDES